MKVEKVNFGRYGKSFQEGLVQLIFQDRPFADQITEVLDVNFIEMEYLRVFLQKMLQFRHRYNKHPSVDAMLTIIKTELDEEDEVIQEKVQDYFSRMHKRELTDIDYIKEISLDFCRKQKLKGAMLKCVGLIKSSSFDEISKTMNAISIKDKYFMLKSPE